MRNLKQILRESICQVLAESNIGYHYGDLGKSERDDYWGLNKGNRHSGFFGFGTYFLGDQLPDDHASHYTERPLRTHSFDNYNLFHPKNYEEGYELHSNLKILNYYIASLALVNDKQQIETYENLLDEIDTFLGEDYLHIKKITNQRIDKLMFNIEYDEEEPPSEVEINKSIQHSMSILEKNGIIIPSQDQFSNPQEYAEELENRIYQLKAYYESEIDEYQKQYKRHKELEQCKKVLGSILGKQPEEIEEAFQVCYQYNQNASQNQRGIDSIPTVFMKKLGFDGVDVRGIDGLDNTDYGSVIYDLHK